MSQCLWAELLGQVSSVSTKTQKDSQVLKNLSVKSSAPLKVGTTIYFSTGSESNLLALQVSGPQAQHWSGEIVLYGQGGDDKLTTSSNRVTADRIAENGNCPLVNKTTQIENDALLNKLGRVSWEHI